MFLRVAKMDLHFSQTCPSTLSGGSASPRFRLQLIIHQEMLLKAKALRFIKEVYHCKANCDGLKITKRIKGKKQSPDSRALKYGKEPS
jgi:hypothetical protein